MSIGMIGFVASMIMQGFSPPCSDDRYNDFDFWVGTWDVYVGESLMGRNVITKEEAGCLVLETWTSARPPPPFMACTAYDPQALLRLTQHLHSRHPQAWLVQI
ncbi:MAG: hypothetical protein AAF225_09990, partial [Pseudomonadota bacterium]